MRSSREAPLPGFPCLSVTRLCRSPAGLRPKRLISSGLLPRSPSGPRKGCPPHCTSAHLPPPWHLTLPAAGFLPRASRQQPRSPRPPAGGCVCPAGSGRAGPTWLAARSQQLAAPSLARALGRAWNKAGLWEGLAQQRGGPSRPSTWREGHGRADVQRCGKAPVAAPSRWMGVRGCQRASAVTHTLPREPPGPQLSPRGSSAGTPGAAPPLASEGQRVGRGGCWGRPAP